jgi:hypothetical protein
VAPRCFSLSLSLLLLSLSLSWHCPQVVPFITIMAVVSGLMTCPMVRNFSLFWKMLFLVLTDF